MKDYTVNTAITFHTGFDDRECNCLMYEGMKEKIKNDIQTAFLSDERLRGYITSDLTLRFLDGYKVRVEYEFSCYDENKQEAEGYSIYCAKGVQNRLEELGIVCNVSVQRQKIWIWGGWMNWNPWYSVREKIWKFNQPDFDRKVLTADEAVKPQLCLLEKGHSCFFCVKIPPI